MSDSSRVIVLAGDGGAGTTTFARRTANEMRDLGLSVAEVDASGDEVGDPSAAVVAALQETLGLLWREAGAEAVLPEQWGGLVGISLLDAWHRIVLARRASDAVVVDAGSLARLRDLAAAPGTLLGLLDAAMTPRSAMWRPSSSDASLFESLSALRMSVREWSAVLQGPRTSARLVARPDAAAIPRLLRTREQVTLVGLLVDGIVVSQAPGKGDHGRKAERRTALDMRDEYRTRVPAVPVWHSTRRIAVAPRGMSAVDVLVDPGTCTPRASTMVVDDVGGGYTLRIPLRDVAGDVRVGVHGASLVLALDGGHAWHELPAVLARCEPVVAYRTEEGLAVRWEPVRDLWTSSLSTTHTTGDHRVEGEGR